MQVTHFERKRVATVSPSIERVFEAVRSAIAESHEDVAITTFRCPTSNRGPFRWTMNAALARRAQSELNHIVGDVHYLAWTLPSARTLLTVHDCRFEERLHGFRRRLAERVHLAGPVRRVAAITVPSSFTLDRLVHLTGVERSRVEVVPHCVPNDFRPVAKEFDVDLPTLLHVGTGPNKNLERVVQALDGLRCRLHVVGPITDSQKAALIASGVAWHSSAQLTDAEVVAAYERADVVLFPSLYEGFGMPILEAQTVGRPVVSSNVGPMPETAGAGAVLVDPLDVTELRNAIREVITNASYRETLIEAGFKNAERFSPQKSADGFAHAYESLAAGRAIR